MAQRDDWLACCYATDPASGARLVMDAHPFHHSCDSVRRLWRRVLEWNGEHAGDPNYRWAIMRRSWN